MSISENHFGQHLILNKDMLDPGGPFDRFVDLLPAQSFRFPGGGVTEDLSPHDGSWDAIFGDARPGGDPDRVVTVKEAFAFAGEHNASINFVLPTAHFFKDGPFGYRAPDADAIDAMMVRVSEMLDGVYGEVRISTFEIGNEYWGGQDKMTAAEYGRIADTMAKSLQAVIDEHRGNIGSDIDWVEPSIAVQTGAWWKSYTDEGSQILNELSPEGRDAIDAVVGHHYPSNYDQAQSHQYFYKEIEKFIKAEGLNDADIYISEWNMSKNTDENGMAQIPGFLSAFDQMIERGVDHANVWGTQYKFLASRLSGMSNNHADGVAPEDVDIWLTPTGEAYRLLQDKAIGTDLLHLNASEILEGDAAGPISIHSYGSDEKTILFISSRAGEPLNLDLDVDALMLKFPGGHIDASLLSAQDIPRTSKDESDPTSIHARAKLENLNHDELLSSGGQFDLPPHGTIVVTITKAGKGVLIKGQDDVIDPSDDLGEVMVGGSGADTIFGNLGNDTIFGGSGNDLLYGGEGDDLIEGGDGSDVLISEDGNDTLVGGNGRDVMVSKGGDTEIETGEDGSLVVVNGGSSHINSLGADYFSIDGAKHVTIDGFDANLDHLYFGVGGNLNSIAAEKLVVSGADLLISSDEIGSVLLTGAASQADLLHKLLAEQVDPVAQAETLASYLDGLSSDQAKALVEETEQAEDLNPVFGGFTRKHLEKFTPEVAGAIADQVGKGDTDEPPQPEPPEDDPSPDDGEATPRPVEPKPPVEPLPGDETGVGDGDWTGQPPDNDVPADDGHDDDIEHGGGGGGGCFIATASFGDGRHPDVMRLRRFRDEVLVVSRTGRAFITMYWIVGPWLAKLATPSNLFGKSVRWAVGRALSSRN
ncbi:calcium-binding protein [Cereibacter sp. SYSU M97828]|nr:calcium-binding protein [Cereibacter flavus]